MATIKINDEVLRPWIQEIVRAAIAELNLPAIAAAAVKAAERDRASKRRMVFKCREAAETLGVKVTTLKEKRRAGHIKGRKIRGVLGYVYDREELERFLGRKLD